ncbi:hypothetical protein LPB140_10020 [Sphingorhabdus lutea]|uniref:YdbS-like PH domain-containing protein n=1 Tax=Sphingorhabdus lutea TaxID=1913578 RepID=A0A1L3JD58_9SPHN|nr:PH domain-containing protein [Sphingorhabdus lutea]APG63065.1 hypothetical protein LPB140_10020 [Sphingorhabdus lutea]
MMDIGNSGNSENISPPPPSAQQPILQDAHINIPKRTSFLGIFINIIAGLPNLIFPMFAGIYGIQKIENIAIPFIIMGVILLTLLTYWLIWLRFTYICDEDEIRIESGIISRNIRTISYDRIQDVSIEQNLIAQILRLAQVKFETGSGKGDDAKLRFVTQKEADNLRNLVRRQKNAPYASSSHNNGERPADDIEMDAPQHIIFQMDDMRIIIFGFFQFSLIIFAVLAGAAQQFDFLLPFEIWDWKHWVQLFTGTDFNIEKYGFAARVFGALSAIFSLIFIGIITGITQTLLREYGYKLRLMGAGFRRTRGLMNKSDVIIAINKIQAAVITSGAIRKIWGWHGLKFISLAHDIGDDGKQASDHIAAPFAHLNEINAILAHTKIDTDSEGLTFHRTAHQSWWLGLLFIIPLPILGIAIASYISGAPIYWTYGFFIFAIATSYFSWTRTKWAMNDDFIYHQTGWWNQKFTILPQDNVQSISVVQGPIMKKLGLARIKFGIGGGYISIGHIDANKAYYMQHLLANRVAPVDFSKLNK